MSRSLFSVLLCLPLLAGQAAAQSDYPSRPVRIVVPSSPGGGTDILARVLADHLARSMNGQFFVENRPGAGQMIGIESVARTPWRFTAIRTPANPRANREIDQDGIAPGVGHRGLRRG